MVKTRRATNRRKTTRKQYAGSRLFRELPDNQQPAISSNVKAIIDPLMKVPMNKRTQGKYIFEVINTSLLSRKEKYDAIKILLDNNFSPDYINPENGQSALILSIKAASDPESERIPMLLLDANVRFVQSPPENLLIISIVRNHEFLPQKLLESGYIPNSNEMKQLGIILRNKPEILTPQNRELLTGYFRARRLAAVDVIKSRKQLNSKRLTGDSAPKTAFVIMGHGGEQTVKKIMPEGCVLVTQVHSGELNHSGGTDIYARIFNYPAAIKSRFLDPITNYEDISDTINLGRGTLYSNYTPLAVYREGDIYPEFIYTLLSYWDSDTDEAFVGEANSYKICDSGLAQYPFPVGPRVCSILNKTSTDYEPLIQAFRRSIYPSSADIRAFIEEMPNPKTIDTVMKLLKDSPLININQTQLSERFGAGVYYNLVCRATSPDLLEKNAEGKTVISSEARQLLNSSHKVRRNHPEIFQAIEEAEAERKDLIELLHLNDPNHFNISSIDDIISSIYRKIASGDRNPRLPYLKYIYSKIHYQDLLNHYKSLAEEYEEYNHQHAQLYKTKIVDLQRTVATPQYLSESDLQSVLHYPQRPVTPEERSAQQKQKAAHNQWLAAHPNINSGVQKPEGFETRARQAELEAQNKTTDWKIAHLFR